MSRAKAPPPPLTAEELAAVRAGNARRKREQRKREGAAEPLALGEFEFDANTAEDFRRFDPSLYVFRGKAARARVGKVIREAMRIAVDAEIEREKAGDNVSRVTRIRGN